VSRRRREPVFEIEYAELPPRTPKRDRRRARREANGKLTSHLDTPRKPLPSPQKNGSREEPISPAHQNAKLASHLPPKRPTLRPAREVRCLTGTAPRGAHEEPAAPKRPNLASTPNSNQGNGASTHHSAPRPNGAPAHHLPPRKPRDSKKTSQTNDVFAHPPPRRNGKPASHLPKPRPIDFAAAVARLEGALERGEAPHPETRQHVAGAESKHGRASDKLSFAAETAAKTGRPLEGAPTLRLTKWF
jgi:hypothetical protein